MSKHEVIDVADTPEGRLRRLLRATMRAGEAPPRLACRYLVKGLLDRGQTSLLYGDSNAGKTALAVRLACDVASGAAFGGLRTHQGGVLYVASEAPGSVLMRTEPHRAELEGAAPLHVLRERVDLCDAGEVDATIHLARRLGEEHDYGIALVMIDTLARSIGDADENLSGPMTSAVDGAGRIAQALGAHVMLIHHTGKTPGDARGSSAIRAAVDTVLALATGRAEEDGQPCVIVRAEKQRDMACAGSLAYRIRAHEVGRDAEGDPVTTTRLEWLLGAASPVQPTKGRARPATPPRAPDAARAEPSRAEAWRDLARNLLKGAAQLEPGRVLTAREILGRCDTTHELLAGRQEDSNLKALRTALKALADDDAEGVQEEAGSKGAYVYAPARAPGVERGA